MSAPLVVIDDADATSTLLCQSESAGCASCCGVYNAADRGTPAFWSRMHARTKTVLAAGWTLDALTQARKDIELREIGLVLTADIPSCPFAGFVGEDVDAGDNNDTVPARLGCLIHPRRHPAGDDLRDLGVYPKEVCDEHRCAPHQWLKPAERALAQTCATADYGMFVTDAGLCKAVHQALGERAHKTFRGDDYRASASALSPLWSAFANWPYRSRDVRRFGAFYLADDAGERSLDDPLAAYPALIEKTDAPLRRIIAALSSDLSTEADAQRAVATLDALLQNIATALCATAISPQDNP